MPRESVPLDDVIRSMMNHVKVIIIKNIHFNKEYTFNRKFKTLQKNVRIMEPGLLQEVLKKRQKGI